MGTWFWINVPLMVLAFALTTGFSYALLLRSRQHDPADRPGHRRSPRRRRLPHRPRPSRRGLIAGPDLAVRRTFPNYCATSSRIAGETSHNLLGCDLGGARGGR